MPDIILIDGLSNTDARYDYSGLLIDINYLIPE